MARAGLIVSAAFLAARLLGWVRTVVIVNQVGVASDLDAFFAAFRIPDLIFQLVAAGALSSALIPIVSGLLANGANERAWKVVSTVINLMLIGLVVLGAIVFVAAPWLVPAITPGFSDANQALTVELTRIMLLSPIFLAMGAVATSVLNANGRFTAAALAPITYNLAIIGAALILAPTYGVAGIAVGVVLGSLSHLLVQVRPMARLGFHFEPRIDLGDAQARKALALMAPRAIGLGATQITFVVVTSLATNLGVGAVTAFNVAFTLLQIPIGVIGVPLGVVVFPSLSREAATGREPEFASLLDRALRILIYVMVPIGALAAILRVQSVALLFDVNRYGQAALTLTANTLLAFLVGLAAHALIAVLARAFYARQDTITPVLAAILAVIVNTSLAVVLVGPYGLPGIALAIAIAAWLEALALLVILDHRLRDFRAAGLIGVGLASIAATAVASAIGVATLTVLQSALGVEPGRIVLLVQIVVVSAVFAAVYALGSLVLRIPELPSIVGVMVDVLRRPRRS